MDLASASCVGWPPAYNAVASTLAQHATKQVAISSTQLSLSVKHALSHSAYSVLRSQLVQSVTTQLWLSTTI